jgi:hypothetical protein
MSSTLNAGFQDRHGDDWGFYQVITSKGVPKNGYALVSLVDDYGLVYVAEHLGFAAKEDVRAMYGPLSEYHN